MNYEAYAFWFGVLQVLIAAGIAVYLRLDRRNRVTAQRMETHEDDMAKQFSAHGDRLVRVEAAINHAPNHSDLARIHERLDDLNMGVSGIRGEFKSVGQTLQTIQEHLINGRG